MKMSQSHLVLSIEVIPQQVPDVQVSIAGCRAHTEPVSDRLLKQQCDKTDVRDGVWSSTEESQNVLQRVHLHFLFSVISNGTSGGRLFSSLTSHSLNSPSSNHFLVARSFSALGFIPAIDRILPHFSLISAIQKLLEITLI